jgi:D-lactate dehydrogenase
MPETYHLIEEEAIGRMKKGVMLINTSRGAIIDTPAAIEGLKSGKIGYLGLDVYEEEGDYFYEDLSNKIIQDDVLARLLTFPNVVVTGHQAFFTRTALENIARTTLENIREFEKNGSCVNRIAANTATK